MNNSNVTYLDVHSYLKPAFAITVSTLTTVTNAMNLIFLWQLQATIDRNQRLLLIFLSGADFGVGFSCMLSIGKIIVGQWPYGKFFCVATAYIRLCFVSMSELLLLVVSLNTYWKFIQRKPMSRDTLWTAIILCLLLSLMCWLPALHGHILGEVNGDYLCSHEKNSVFSSIHMILIILPTVIAMTWIHLKIMLKTLKIRGNAQSHNHIRRHSSAIILQKKRLLKYRSLAIVTRLLTAFYITTIPFTSTQFIDSLCCRKLSLNAKFYMRWLLFSNSTINFFIYSMEINEFRSFIKHIFRIQSQVIKTTVEKTDDIYTMSIVHTMNKVFEENDIDKDEWIPDEQSVANVNDIYLQMVTDDAERNQIT